MYQANNFGMGRFTASLAMAAFVLAGSASASAGEAAAPPAPERNVSAPGPCSAFFEKFPDSRARALLECQNEATSKVTPYLTAEEASKIYDTYLERMSKERADTADKRD
jgi:hypothetical protein